MQWAMYHQQQVGYHRFRTGLQLGLATSALSSVAEVLSEIVYEASIAVYEVLN